MNGHLAIMTSVLVTSAAFAGEPTFESLQNDFQQKALSLLSEENISVMDLQARVAKFADETFGAHPDLVRKESERRFGGLPQFPATNLAAYVEHKSWDEFPVPPPGTEWIWLMSGWDPVKLADSAKKTILSRQLGPKGYGRLALLSACCPDKVYRLGEGKFPALVVNSLGDLFVIKVEMTEAGVCRPVSVRWMKKRPRATP